MEKLNLLKYCLINHNSKITSPFAMAIWDLLFFYVLIQILHKLNYFHHKNNFYLIIQLNFKFLITIILNILIYMVIQIYILIQFLILKILN